MIKRRAFIDRTKVGVGVKLKYSQSGKHFRSRPECSDAYGMIATDDYRETVCSKDAGNGFVNLSSKLNGIRSGNNGSESEYPFPEYF
jgi:hypothetical protein